MSKSCDELVTIGATYLGKFFPRKNKAMWPDGAHEVVPRQNAEKVIAAKDARIDEYETGLVQMHQEISALEADNAALTARIAELEADNKRLREALSIFLGDATMEGLLWGDAKSTDLVTIRVQKQKYDSARAALGEVKP